MLELEYENLEEIMCHQACYVEMELGESLAALLMTEIFDIYEPS